MGNKNLIVAFILVLLAIAGGLFLISQNNKPGKLDRFAQCLKDKGAVFYGAFWCPHCHDQEKMFGSSQKYLNYVECSTPDGQGQLKVCKNKGIEGYPTWEFSGGSRETGDLSLSKLSEKTGCSLPK